MRKFIKYSIFAILVFTSYSNAQSEVWQALTASRMLTSINFISGNKSIIFGGDIIYRSIDGGNNWGLPILQSPSINANYKTISFVDSLFGWAIKDDQTLYKTVNGGNSWSTINISMPLYGINGISFVNRNTGFMCVLNDNSISQIAKSTNSGVSWEIINSNLPFHPNQILMVNERRGFIEPFGAWDSIGYTTNGGYDWSYQRVGDPSGQNIGKIFFIDSLKGWVMGDPGYVSRTTNGGLNWNIYFNNIGNTTNMFFIDEYTGWITSNSGTVSKSTNSGMNWFFQINNPGGCATTDCYMYDVYFKNGFTGWALKGNGTVYKSINGGNNWSFNIVQPIGDVESICFQNNEVGWLISNKVNFYSQIGSCNNGYIYKTTNSGYNWSLQFMTANYDTVKKIVFLNSSTGFVCANSKIFKTENGGQNWNIINVNGYQYYSMDFINDNTGWAVGKKGYSIKTTSAGLSWSAQISGIIQNINDVDFLDFQNGFAAADSGYVLKTTNGGENWSSTRPFGNRNYKSIVFINANTGFAIGNRSYTVGIYPYSDRTLLKTTNSGINWFALIDENIFGWHYFNDVTFLNDITGWIVTSNSGIIKTTNSGNNWFSVQSPINGNYTCVQFVNSQFGWIGGANGTILSTSPPIGIQTIYSETPNSFVLSQNYPNPFNPQTKIKFDIPANVNGQTSYVKLIIYDLLGREVATLVNEELKPGTYEADWDGSNFSSGVYFYKLFAGDFTETKKMVLMK